MLIKLKPNDVIYRAKDGQFWAVIERDDKKKGLYAMSLEKPYIETFIAFGEDIKTLERYLKERG